MAEMSTLNGYKIKDKKAIRYYDTVADMVADTTLKSGMHAKTKGYHSINDGGGCDYHIISTASESEYQEILNNGLYATLIIENDCINIKKLGAYGDGEHDDINAFKIFENSNIKKLIIPEGTYNLSDILTFDNKEIIGIGQPSLNYVSQTTSREHYIKLTTAFKIENITFNQLVNNTKTIGVFDCSYSYFKNCKFISDGFICGSELDLYTNNHDILIDNCYFKLKSVNSSDVNQEGGIWVREYDETKETYNITFNNCNVDHQSADEIIAVWNWYGLVHHVTINNCTLIGLEENTAPWLITFNVDNSSINDSFIENKRLTTFSGMFKNNENIDYNNITVNNCFIKQYSAMQTNFCTYKMTFNNCNIENTTTKEALGLKSTFNNCNFNLKQFAINGGNYYGCYFEGDGTTIDGNPIVLQTYGTIEVTDLYIVNCTFKNYTFGTGMFIYVYNNCNNIIIRDTIIDADLSGLTYFAFGSSDVTNLQLINTTLNKGVYLTGTTGGVIANNITNRTINAFSNVKVNNNFNITT